MTSVRQQELRRRAARRRVRVRERHDRPDALRRVRDDVPANTLNGVWGTLRVDRRILALHALGRLPLPLKAVAEACTLVLR
jgi:hypothetical protein